jgi:CelD/BcsL family acetyltransferase involved in cellulose biosynthesis
MEVIGSAATAWRLRGEWHDLLARSGAGANGLALTPEWLLAWWREFGGLGGRRLRLAVLRRGPRLVGLAPLLSRRAWYPPGIPFRRLEMLGTGEPEADSICSDYLNVIVERGAEAEVAAALTRAAAGRRLGDWDEIVLTRLDGDDPMTAALAAAGLATQRRSLDEAPYIPLPATWDDYLKRLDRKKRYLVRHSHDEFVAWAGADRRLGRATTADGLARGKRALVALHHERWQGGGSFRSPRFLRFHDTMMDWRLREGGLELLTLYARGEPAAALYGLVWDGKVYFYQCGRKLDVPKNVRPGGILIGLAIRAAIEAGRREFDFLGGSATYKAQLVLATRPLVAVRAARPTWRERLRLLAEHGRGPARALKRALRRLLGRSGP